MTIGIPKLSGFLSPESALSLPAVWPLCALALLARAAVGKAYAAALQRCCDNDSRTRAGSVPPSASASASAAASYHHAPQQEGGDLSVKQGRASNGVVNTIQPLENWALERAKRLVTNDRENLGLALCVLVPFVRLLSHDDRPYLAHAVAALYTASRVLHALCLAAGLQPLRSYAFFLGGALLCASGVMAVLHVPSSAAATATASPAAKAAVMATAVLTVKVYLTLVWLAVLRRRLRSPTLPEDAKVLGGRVLPAASPAYPERVARVERIHANDVQNIPLSLLVSIAFAAHAQPTGPFGPFLIWVFVASRVAHTVAYQFALQPLRSVVFVVGQLAVLAMAIHAAVHTLRPASSAAASDLYATAYTLSLALLFAKAAATGGLAAYRRVRAGFVVTPEDLRYRPTMSVLRRGAPLPESFAGLVREHLDDLDVVPPFLGLGLLLQPRTAAQRTTAAMVVALFVLLRFAATLCHRCWPTVAKCARLGAWGLAFGLALLCCESELTSARSWRQWVNSLLGI